MITPPTRRVANDLTEAEFIAWYGPWNPMSIPEIVELMSSSPVRWWIAGGWAIELETGISRDHDDVDLAINADDLAAFRTTVPDLHLWEAHSGSLTPLLPGNELQEGREQLWARAGATEPWRLDLLLSPVDGQEWVFKRDHSIRMPLDQALRTTADGVSYLAPHIVLLYKARLLRDKDRADFAVAVPRLDADERAWLTDALTRHLGDHEWIDALG